MGEAWEPWEAFGLRESVMVGAIVRVAYLGPRSSFTHLAAETLFPNAEHVAVKSIQDVFIHVERHQADYGVVPVENSLEGPVGETLDMLASSMLYISAALEARIVLVLAGNPQARIVYGHPYALRAAARQLEELVPGAELVPVSSTSQAAEQAAREGQLCVCSKRAAREYGLEIVKEGVEDTANYTRFIAVGWHDNAREATRTSIVAAIPDEPGSLYRLLEPFARHNINLTMIYSRPQPWKPWHYIFYIDMQGSRLEENVARALREAARHTLFLRILGSYPVYTSNNKNLG